MAFIWSISAIYILGGVVCCLLLLALRLWYIISGLHKGPIEPLQLTKHFCRVTILLGLGGHTTEMLALLQALCLQRYTPRTYIITEGDTLSERRTIRWEANQPQTQTVKNYTICSLPRARKVGQSFLTTPWSVIKSAIAAISIIWQQSPDLFICNGPGSCVPVCVIILIYRALGLSNTQIVYVESFARTQTLSLTGRILYLAVDCFVVQWPTLKDKYPRAIYSGVLV